MSGDWVESQEPLLTKTDLRVKICLGDRKLCKKGERLHKMSEVERPVQKLVLLLEAD